MFSWHVLIHRWTEFEFGGDLTQPDTCPIYLDSLQQDMPFVGYVSFGNDGAWAEDADGFLKVYANLGLGSYQNVTGDPAGAIDIQDQYDDIAGRWEGSFVGTYIAASAPPAVNHPEKDTAVFKTTIDATFAAPLSGFPEVDAGAVLPWTQSVRSHVSGPNSAGRLDNFTLAGSVHSGKTPYSYEWFHEGSSVASGSATYDASAANLEAGTDHTFTLYVVDAEGDSGTAVHGVYVRDPSEGEIGDGDRCIVEPC